MQDVTPDLVRAIFRRTVAPTAVLVTLEADGVDPIRASSDPDGTTSNGEDFPYFPFSFAWGGASAEEPSKRAKLEIGSADGRIEDAIRALPNNAAPTATVQLVRVAAPDVVEVAIDGASVDDVEFDAPKVTANLSPRDFSEPACHARYTAARTPALF